MMDTNRTDISTAKAETTANSVDNPLNEDVIDGPDIGTSIFMQHLLFIFSSFQLTIALANSIPILPDCNSSTDQIADRPSGKKAIDRLFPSSNPLDFLDIDLGCVPVSIDVAAHNVTWPNWAVLLPEIPSNSRFKVLGANV